MRLLAALYVAAILTLVGVWLIRKSDRYFWYGVLHGGLFMVGWVLFLVAVMELVDPMVWR
jgi:hypothetical protein